LSLLVGKQATARDKSEAIKILQEAFPKMNPGFWSVLMSVISEDGWSGKRLSYAVSRIIRTHTYQSITIADFVGIDKIAQFVSQREAQSNPKAYVMLDNGCYIRIEDYYECPEAFNIRDNQRWKINPNSKQ